MKLTWQTDDEVLTVVATPEAPPQPAASRKAYPSTVPPTPSVSIGMLNLGAPPVTSLVDTNETWTAFRGLALWLLQFRYTPTYSSLALRTIVALSAPVIVTVPVPNVCSLFADADAATPPNPMAATAATMSTSKKRFICHSSSRLPSDAGLPILPTQVRSCIGRV